MSDRISELPDGVLSHILSFLETKWAVCTTALSKRWTNLVWNSLSNLHLDENSFRKQSQFKHFINHVLDHRDKTLSLDKLIFITKNPSSCRFVTKPLEYALSRGLKHLQISMPNARPADFSEVVRVLNTQVMPMSLRVLKLISTGLWYREIDTLFCLPKLEILHLRDIMLGPNLLSNCENLVELCISRCGNTSDKENLVICAPQLTTLTFSHLFPRRTANKTIMLVSPKLRTFKLKAFLFVIPVIHTDEFFHLKTAVVSVKIKIEDQESTMNMLQKLCHARHVTLSMPTLELLHQIGGAREVPALSPFSNLKTFRITTGIEKYSPAIKQRKVISISVINQVLSSILQSSCNVGIFIDLPRPCKRPRN